MDRDKSPLPDEGEGTGGGRRSPDAGDRRKELIRWAGLGTEMVASVGLSVFLGVKADKWLKLSFPILSWLLPLLVIAGLLINLVRSGSKKNNGK
jgi:hypothetical protein